MRRLIQIAAAVQLAGIIWPLYGIAGYLTGRRTFDQQRASVAAALAEIL